MRFEVPCIRVADDGPPEFVRSRATPDGAEVVRIEAVSSRYDNAVVVGLSWERAVILRDHLSHVLVGGR